MSDVNKAIDLNQFEIRKYLDKGSFGQVYEVLDKRTNNIYAAKIFHNPIDPHNNDSILNLTREVNNNSRFNHPSILQFIGFSLKDFNNDDRPVIITELAQNGSLHKVIDYEKRGLSIPGWNDTKKLITIFGIASGMSFLHENDVLHRDLKLENILIDERLFPKISDFGFSKIAHDDGHASSIQSISTIKGTPAYMAPEIIENQNYTKAGDIFAFGMIVYEIMTTERAFSGLSIKQVFDCITKNERPNIGGYVPEPYRELIQRCWSQDPKDRPTFDDIVAELQEDKFLTSTIEDEDYSKYIEFINEYRTTYDRNKKIISFDDIIRNTQSNTFRKVSIKDIASESKKTRILPTSIFIELSENHQKLVDESIKDPEKQFIVGKYLIEGQKDFPINLEYGIKYLEQSSDDGCIDSALYLSNLYFKGEKIPQDTNKAKEYLLRYEYSNDCQVYNLLGLIYQKENNIIEAKKYFHKGCKINPESMFEYSMILLNEDENESNIDEAFKYLEISQKREFSKSVQYLYIYGILNAYQDFSSLPKKIQHIFIIRIIENNKNKVINENNIYNKIKFTGKDIPHLYKKDIIFKPFFYRTLQKFSNVSFEIDYPSDFYSSILSQLGEIKHKYIKNLDIHVLILSSTRSHLQETCNGVSFITHVTISPSIKRIGMNAFRGCSSLTQISIPSSIVSIGSCSFWGCTSLTEISIPSSVITIGPRTFWGCTSLTRVSIPTSVKKIQSESFKKCSSLRQISLPSQLEFIGGSIFVDCFYLNEILIQQNQEANLELLENMYLVFKETTDKGFYYTLVWARNCIVHANIPPMINVIKNGALFNHYCLTDILIPGSVESIEEGSFQGCSSLQNVSFEVPSNLKYIGDFSFYDTKLSQLSIPSSVKSIGDYSFSRSLLVQITIPAFIKFIGNNAFRKCTLLKQISFEIPSSIKLFEESVFRECTSLTQISIPSSVESIDKYAFKGCSSLTQVIFETPSSLKSIEDETFYECSSLTEITIPASVKSIGKNVFQGCSSLKQISFDINSSIKSFKKDILKGCTSLTQILIPSSVQSIEKDTFKECLSLTEIIFETPSSLKSIEDETFYECSTLAEIIIPSSVESIGKNAFQGCSSLKQISFEIPSSIKLFEENVFRECTSLTQISIPSSVESIDKYAFKGCSSLTQVIFETPSSLKSIEDETFYECSSLTEITIPASVKSIGKNVFQGCSSLKQISFEIPSSIKSFKKDILKGCTSLTQILIPSSVQSIKKGTFKECLSLTEIIFETPSSLKSIEDETFYECSTLAEIIIPSSIKSIGKSTFQGCSLLNQVLFEIPSSLTSFAEDVFSRCSFLTHILIPSSVESIDKAAFRGCSSLAQIIFEIPSSLNSIGEEAFYECTSLTEITIPTPVKSIGNNAFQGCLSLKKIEIPPTIISIGNEAFKNCSSLVPFHISSSVTSIFLGCKRRICNVQ